MKRVLLTALICFGVAATAARAQSGYPDHPVKVIVPSTPGGGSDTFARLVAQGLSDELGQQFYIENRPGGGTLIGMEAAAHSKPDGYTLYLAPSTITLLPLVKKKMPVTLANFEPISLAAILPQALLVNPSVKAKNVRQFIALAKKNPGKLTYGDPGIGTGPQMAMQLLINSTGIQMLHIPYKGVANVVIDLLAGRVSSMMLNMAVAKPQILSGKVRALGVTSLKRVEGVKNIPTIAEQGIKGYEALQWFGYFAPAGTPKPIVDKIQRAMAKSLHSAKVKQRLALEAAEPGGDTPEHFAKFLKGESAKWTAVAKAAHIMPR